MPRNIQSIKNFLEDDVLSKTDSETLAFLYDQIEGKYGKYQIKDKLGLSTNIVTKLTDDDKRKLNEFLDRFIEIRKILSQYNYRARSFSISTKKRPSIRGLTLEITLYTMNMPKSELTADLFRHYIIENYQHDILNLESKLLEG